jgi:hypothetical protein
MPTGRRILFRDRFSLNNVYVIGSLAASFAQEVLSSRACSRMTSTARSSGYNDRSGATEHTLQSEWGGALAHRPVSLKLFTELMSSDYPVLGLLLCEVGNLDDLLDAAGKKRLEDVIREAFRDAGATDHGACTREDMTALQECVNQFFSRRAVLQSTPPRQDAKAARVLKPSSEIAHAWQVIMDRRRLEEPNDRRKIEELDTLNDMHNKWMHEWLEKNLTSEQRCQTQNKKTSIFAAYLNREFGGKRFVMALWQTGIQWAPTPEMIRDDHNGALEHVATNFAKWTQRVACAITRISTLDREKQIYARWWMQELRSVQRASAT